jgi:beta-galactosidase
MASLRSRKNDLHGLRAFASALVLLGAVRAAPAGAAARVESLDADWRFYQGDAPGADAPEFDDSAWRPLDVPHDWSIEGAYDRDAPTGRGGGYRPAGVGWYRKHFKLPAEDEGRRASIEFDGVMAHSDVWINGVKLGHRPFGYASFRYDMTPHVRFGDDADNVLAVRADNTRQPASRWYAGAGVYRHVRLVVDDAVRFQHHGIFVTTPQVTENSATVRIVADVVNEDVADAPVNLSVEVRDATGIVAAAGATETQMAPGNGVAFLKLELEIPNPRLWSPHNPALYKAAVRLSREGSVATHNVRFGIREFRFEPDTGFRLNGENMKVKGVCLHHDGGAVGAAVPKDVWRRRLERLKSLGVNAIRTAHNPAAPEFLDLCDELGFLVMHEVFDCWTVGKNNAQGGYQHDFREWWETDLRDAVLRDRNHPSIILYSAGNEIRDNLRSPAGFEQFKKMKAIYDGLDGTRPVTMAIFRPNQSGVYTSGFSELMDVVGQNYREAELVRAHRDQPTRKILGTENGHDRSVWLMMRDNPAFSGQFLWTGIDYMGESDWPYTTWGDALLDRAGFVKPAGLQRQSWWSDQPMVAVVRSEAASGGASGRGAAELVDHWTPRDPDTYDEATAFVYSNCEEVELVLNGESLGRQAMPDNAAPAEFKFPFDAGECVAIGYRNGEPAARQTLKTAGEPAALRLTADRNSLRLGFDHVVHVEFEIVDSRGVRCTWSDAEVTFAVTGPGQLVAIDNADPQSHESFQGPARRAFHGRGLAIVRRTPGDGLVTVTASSPGLAPASVRISLTSGSF